MHRGDENEIIKRMAKEVTVLGIEGAFLRGVRLEERNGAFVCADVASWPLAEEAPDGDAGETPAAPPDLLEEAGYSIDDMTGCTWEKFIEVGKAVYEKTGKYDRFQYDGPQIDDLTGEQLSYDNVILQYNFWVQLDDKDYLAFDCHQGGAIQYCTKGKCIPGTWKREINEDNYDMSAIRYYDMDGNEIEINNGKTFICVIQNDEVENVVVE